VEEKGDLVSQDRHNETGARDRERSGDLVFFRHALYQLSYPGKGSQGFAFRSKHQRAFVVGDDGLEPPTSSV
jgi:hypothetical protein